MVDIKHQHVTDDDIDNLSSSLESLSFYRCTIDESAIEKIGKLTHLTWLSMIDVHFPEKRNIKNIEFVGNLNNLTSLVFCYNDYCGDIEPIGKLSNLRAVNLCDNMIASFNPLLKLSKLVHVNITNNEVITYPSSESLSPIIVPDQIEIELATD